MQLNRLNRSAGSVGQGNKLPRSSSLLCRATQEPTSIYVPRRGALLAAGLVLSSPLIMPTGPALAKERLEDIDKPVKSLSTFQKKGQRDEFRTRAEAVIRQKLGKDDAADAMRLALHCVADYDAATKTGGFNGSILANPEELARPENASLKAFASKMMDVKAAVDASVAEAGYPPISYADLMVLAVKDTTQAKWVQEKLDAGAKDTALAFGAPWELTLGRVDSTVSGKYALAADDAPVSEVKASLLKLGAKPGADSGPFSPKPPFWEKPGFMMWCAAAQDEAAEEARLAAADPTFASIKAEADGSRRTVTRTNYEVDFITFFNRLSNLGAKFDENAYLKPMKVQAFRL